MYIGRLSMRRNIVIICIIIVVFIMTPGLIFDIFLDRDIENISKYKSLDGKRINVLNKDGIEIYKLAVEDFLPLTVAKQVAVSSDDEYIKLYTVLMRTYICEYMGDSEMIDTTSLALPYVTYEEMEDAWGGSFYANLGKYQKAAEATKCECIFCNNELIVPYFHEASSGKTRNGNESESLKEYEYLKSVDSDDKEAVGFSQKEKFEKNDFYKRLKDYRDTIILSEDNPLESVSIVERDSAGYVKTIQVGSTLLSGDEFMACFDLKSPQFLIDEEGKDIIITTSGIGNGYGLSLFGAKGMINQGKTYREILNYYYNMIEIR